jgi:hypothetical protein
MVSQPRAPTAECSRYEPYGDCGPKKQTARSIIKPFADGPCIPFIDPLSLKKQGDVMIDPAIARARLEIASD